MRLRLVRLRPGDRCCPACTSRSVAPPAQPGPLAAPAAGWSRQLPLIRYGTTETGLDVSNPAEASRPDTVGLPLPGWTAGSGPRGGRPARTVIRLRGPQVFAGSGTTPRRRRRPSPPRLVPLRRLGGHRPGLRSSDHRGRTKKELIISGGLNVYPREVEVALEQHPSVAEAVSGTAPSALGEQVTAWIVPRPRTTVSEAELVSAARQDVAGRVPCPETSVRPGRAAPRPDGQAEPGRPHRHGRPPPDHPPLATRTPPRPL